MERKCNMKRFSSLLIACMCVFMLVGCQSQKNNFYKNTEEPYHYFQDYTLKFNEKYNQIFYFLNVVGVKIMSLVKFSL
jgi:hypothetical protein